MTRLLIRMFVRNYQNPQDIHVRESYGKFSGIVGLASNFILFLTKIITGVFFGSISIIADAFNNLSDSVSSIITLVGFKLASKPADRKHPYGHARIEYISGLIVSLIVVVVGFQLAKQSLDKIIHPEANRFSLLATAILVISILIKLWQSSFYKKVGEIIGSNTLSANSADSLNDVISTSTVLIGLVITHFTGFNLDGYLGLVVAVLIMISGYKLVLETSNPLLGEAPSQEFVEDIYNTIQSYDGILGIHDLCVHNYGPGRCFVSVHCEVPAEQDIMVSHDIIDNIERDFLTKKGIHLVIHMDPVTTNDERTNRLKEQVNAFVREISPQVTMHDFRVVWGTTHSNLVFDISLPFEFFLKDEEVTDIIEKRIKGIDENYYPVITVDHDYVPLNIK